jgi:hypothetical protein
VDIFERGPKKAAEIDESAVRELHAKIVFFHGIGTPLRG